MISGRKIMGEDVLTGEARYREDEEWKGQFVQDASHSDLPAWEELLASKTEIPQSS
jgi:hypothetical protein